MIPRLFGGMIPESERFWKNKRARPQGDNYRPYKTLLDRPYKEKKRV
jgi:hypothetical protein